MSPHLPNILRLWRSRLLCVGSGLVAAVAVFACGGGDDARPDMDLGSGIFMTADGAIVVTPSRSPAGR